jgi:aldehyde dehydrogenase (NAD+)
METTAQGIYSEQEIQDLVTAQRAYYNSNVTLPVEFRLKQLKKFRYLIRKHEDDLHAAIYKDFGKSKYDNQLTEIFPLYEELDIAIKNVRRWVQHRKVKTNLLNQPAKSYLVPEPLGVSLVIGAWNFPYNLSLIPVVGSMVAGNTTILKPSELPVETSKIMAKIINENFDKNYLHVVEGGIPETTAILKQRFDKVFFTGSPQVGKIVNQAAAAHLTSVTLELGGKNPALFTKDATIDVGVKRMVWAKFLNSGQLCLAPDYALVHKDIKSKVLESIVTEIKKNNFSVENENFVRIINTRNFDRVVSLIDQSKVFFGGKTNREERLIEPTVLNNVSLDDTVMQDEIFGPIIPVIEYNTIDEAFQIIKHFEKPLAAYLFSNDADIKNRFLTEIPFGSGGINEAVMQNNNSNLPFGGVGNSGMGRYHGKYSFENFSHFKAILDKANFFESDLKYYGHSDRQMKVIKTLS